MTEPPEPDLPLTDALEEAALQILDGDERQRAARLDALLREHPRHARALRTWLVASGALAPPPADAAELPAPGVEDEARLPRPLGRYVLEQVLGRGGFGTVYRAAQQRPIRRAVAVKVLNPGMDSREILARFAAEREALNRMDHPGIARLLDAGTTPRGLPYFVMELVEGEPLRSWCRKRALSVRQRVELFLQVCEATQHAHQKQVLHRDLSANNVLVTESDAGAQPKIIDFGIAKSLADPLLEGAAQTFQGALMGTPEYMSPEQAAGRLGDVDTRADVYALGAQLYELLTEQLPISSALLRARGVQGIAEVIAAERPAAASAVAPAARRAQLRGDMDAIAAKALAKDPDLRYASVGEFAGDLRRFLADEPVDVASPSRWRRLLKFLRRNRAPALAVAGAFGAACVAVVLLVFALQRANREAALKDQANLELKEMADAGFRLLANEDRIERARARALQLPPPWPEHRGAYEDWQREFVDRLRVEQEKVRTRLEELDAERRAAGGALQDDVDRHLARALERLDAQLAAFLGRGGDAAAVAARRRWSEEHLAAGREPEAWRRAQLAIKSSPEYRGLQLPRLAGLTPLGRNPRTRLWEFLDLRTHADGYPLPPRDPDTGDLVADGGCGVVMVLLPGGRLAIGARREAPGLERNDPRARDDELSDAIVALEPFLIAQTEMTVAQYARLVGADLPELDPRMPQTDVDWRAAARALRPWGMQLPTEAQWEYACRAGASSPWSSGGDPARAAEVGWLDGDLARCGLLRPNAFGLFDMHGNVAEWCRDEKLPYPDFPARAGDGLRAR
ncbi:MAG: bifunctional serine/threonine-protein kinase/formylglycine-generating enzyme family protein, partial [Planctomycetota bacterium]